MDNNEFKFESEKFEDIKSEVELDSKETEAESIGGLDDTNLSDDFVIGKDFFIDSSEADMMVEDEDKQPGVSGKKKKKKSSTSKGCFMSVIWMVAILVIAIGAASALLFLGMDYLGVTISEDATVDIEIVVEKGTTAKQVAKQLKQAGLIDSELFFRFYARQSGHDSKFQYGIYYFCKQDSYEDIAEALTKQGTLASSVKVTIPEGWSIDQIAERLEENGICTASQFKEAVNEANSSKYNYKFLSDLRLQTQGVHYILEGYLFPDTYEFYNTNDKSGAEQAIKKMLANMDKKLTDDMYKRAEELGLSMHEVLTLASIIEMESSVASFEDKQKVSAVFHNRLNNSAEFPLLQSDPTSNYPYNKDKYDTYKAPGLAPGAYCSPGFDSIKAALYPDENCTAYYFVTDKDMNFFFNNTLKEHNNTILKLKREGLWA